MGKEKRKAGHKKLAKFRRSMLPVVTFGLLSKADRLLRFKADKRPAK